MGTLYKVFFDFEMEFSLATEQGIITIANNCKNNDDNYKHYKDFTDFETAKKFLENEIQINVIDLETSFYTDLEDKTLIDIGDNYITLY